ncbi:MAG: hypothetical protein AAGC77_12245 [Pseudomonadota bacterium]
MKSLYLSFWAGVALTITAPGVASAQSGSQMRASGAERLIGNLQTGERLALENETGDIRFAGRTIALSEFSGLMGYSADLAYVLTFSGRAELAGESAKSGRMLLIQPFEEKPLVERFDARRLHAGVAMHGNEMSETLAEALNALAKKQGRGIFFGRLGRTEFNVAAAESKETEQNRRRLLGDQAIRDIRFSSNLSGSDVVPTVVSSFVAALAAGDMATAAQFIDPTPFGFGDLSQDGFDARLLTAEALLNQRDWSGLSSPRIQQISGTKWIVSGAQTQALVTTRLTTDFAFVQSISVSE